MIKHEKFSDATPAVGAFEQIKERLVEAGQKVATWWSTPIENTQLFVADTADNHDMGKLVSYAREANKTREIEATLKGFAEEQGLRVDQLRQQFPDHSDEYIFRRLLGLRVSKHMK